MIRATSPGWPLGTHACTPSRVGLPTCCDDRGLPKLTRWQGACALLRGPRSRRDDSRDLPPLGLRTPGPAAVAQLGPPGRAGGTGRGGRTDRGGGRQTHRLRLPAFPAKRLCRRRARQPQQHRVWRLLQGARQNAGRRDGGAGDRGPGPALPAWPEARRGPGLRSRRPGLRQPDRTSAGHLGTIARSVPGPRGGAGPDGDAAAPCPGRWNHHAGGHAVRWDVKSATTGSAGLPPEGRRRLHHPRQPGADHGAGATPGRLRHARVLRRTRLSLPGLRRRLCASTPRHVSCPVRSPSASTGTEVPGDGWQCLRGEPKRSGRPDRACHPTRGDRARALRSRGCPNRTGDHCAGGPSTAASVWERPHHLACARPHS